MSQLDTLKLVFVLAARSVPAHKMKSLFVGSILFFGTLLVVIGRSMLGSVEASMTKSVTSSLTGHLQVYAKDAEDELAVFGAMAMGQQDIGEIPRFAESAARLSEVDNVAGVVPMGITIATVFSQTELDGELAKLREAARAGDRTAMAERVPRIRKIAENLASEQDNRVALSNDPAGVEADKEALATVIADPFWAPFLAPPAPDAPALTPDAIGGAATPEMLAALDFLDTRVAGLAQDGRLLYLRTIGTDLEQFRTSFDRFYIVDGEMVPPGKRGFLLSKRTYEQLIKNKVARELDAIKKAVVVKGQTIAGDTVLQEQVLRNSRQYQRIIYQLSPSDAAVVEAELRKLLPEVQGGLDVLVQEFLKVDDSNLLARYDAFYAIIAPKIKLYDVNIGDTLTLRAYTKSGYVRSINVKIYGTYEFKGLENSDLAGASNLTDLVTWRELYGKMTDEQQAELSGIRANAGIAEVSREDAEAALFGGGGSLVTEAVAPAEPVAVDANAPLGKVGALDERTYTPGEMRDGLSLNAAIILKDPSKIAETQEAIQAYIDANGLNLQVVDWQSASGLIGQFIWVMRGVLLISLFIIFLVSLIIVNNSMVMATMDRVGEIGTLRAIGAQRSMVVALFLAETLLLGLVAGGLGSAAAVAIVAGWWGNVGIPAVADILVVLFAGPRLYPTFSAMDIVFAMGTVVGVGLLSTLYPAVLASRIQPIVAMQGKE